MLVILLAVLEYGVMVAAVYLAHSIRFFGESWDADVGGAVWPRAHCYALINFLCMMAMGAYRPRANKEGLTGALLRVMVAIFLIGTAVLTLCFYWLPSLQLYFGRGVLAIASVASLAGITLLRLMFYRVSDLSLMRWSVLVVGVGIKAKRIADMLSTLNAADIHVAGFYAVTGSDVEIDAHRIIGNNKSIYKVCNELNIQEIIVAVDERRRSDNGGFPLDDLLDCKLNGISVIDDIGFCERETGRLDTRTLSPGWLVFSDGFSFSPGRDYFKRLFDFVISGILLLVTWPLMLLAVIAIKLEDGLKAPLIYSQERAGYAGRPFKVHKFRSMRVDAEKDGKAVWAQKNDNRITRVGNFIRQTRIDELPQIFNVFKGDMSFVGPRPERPQFVAELNAQIPFYNERHRVKPGITGWAQLCYPYGASVEDAEHKLQYDLYYVKNRNLLFDLMIIIQTVEVILVGKGVR